jgi:hypothetical protein
MLEAARVTLKLHRFEVGAAAIVTIAAGVWALVVELQVRMLGVPTACVDAWLASVTDEQTDCLSSLQAWSGIVETPLNDAMGFIPLAAGLLGSIPIVARELESGTAQIAWSLNPSRRRWLLRQLAPVMGLLGACLAFAAVASAMLEADRVIAGYSAFEDLGRYGPLIMARALGAFGIGLLVGALLGRTLPAAVLAVAVTVALAFAVSIAREEWLSRLEPVVVSELSAEGATIVVPHAVITAIGFRAPDGRQISLVDARAIAHAGGASQPGPDDEQDLPAAAWLEQHGYAELGLGVTREMALGWAPIDALLFSIAGAGGLATTILVVDRKRPT